MEEKRTRKERALETKTRLFETAAALIKEKGYEHVTVSEICQRAGVAKGSFYVHYRSKEDIVRESYYSDMGEYLLPRYRACAEEGRPPLERIRCFLNLELSFAEYAGYELTCLAYALNLSACVPGPSDHFEKRGFTEPLREDIRACLAERGGDLSCEDVFLYLESAVRGIMATWCFSNQSFRITEAGVRYVDQLLREIWPE